MQKDKMPKLVIIAGPTAIGKSEISIKLAKRFNAEIISADSMQIYCGLNIGTGKLTTEEMQGIPHHLINIINPDERYSAGRFVSDAQEIIQSLYARKKNIIITGGTGLYLSALIQGYNFANAERSEEIRNRYHVLAETKGNTYLYDLLCEKDLQSAQKISVNDTKRLVRALEIYDLTGEAKSGRATGASPGYNSLFIVLTCDRGELYSRINARVERMMELGLLNEAEGLLPFRDCQSMQAIGYKEFAEYFDGHAGLSETVEKIKKNSRNYAKRQMTFFRWLKADKLFMDSKDYETIEQSVKTFIMSDIVPVLS